MSFIFCKLEMSLKLGLPRNHDVSGVRVDNDGRVFWDGESDGGVVSVRSEGVRDRIRIHAEHICKSVDHVVNVVLWDIIWADVRERVWESSGEAKLKNHKSIS